MRVNSTSPTGKRTVNLAEETAFPKNHGAGNPHVFALPIHVALGDTKEGRRLELLLTVDEAKRLIAALQTDVAWVIDNCP